VWGVVFEKPSEGSRWAADAALCKLNGRGRGVEVRRMGSAGVCEGELPSDSIVSDVVKKAQL
jgi:hypothetical protein